MDTINVLILAAAGEQNLRRIADISPRIKVIDGSKVWDPRDPIERAKGEHLSTELKAMLAEAEVIFGFQPPENFTVLATELKWFQSMLAGVDHILTEEVVKSSVILTNTSGVHGTPVGETAVGMMLAFAKRFHTAFESRRLGRWERYDPEILRGKTVGIIGLGAIGSEVARLCKAFGMRVIGTRRSAKQVSRGRYVDAVMPVTQLNDLMSQSDYVVMTLPSTPETNKMVGEKELKTMKSTAYLINVGRGSTIDEEALVRACEEGWIAGAGMDAFTIEPLPKGSRLWTLPNVIFTPHVSGRLKNYVDVTIDLFCKNLKRYVEGKKLFNIVNKKLGY